MDQNDYQRMDPILPYSRRYVVVGEEQREILDTHFYSIPDYYHNPNHRESLARLLVLTRYPSRIAAREAELSLNGLVLGGS